MMQVELEIENQTGAWEYCEENWGGAIEFLESEELWNEETNQQEPNAWQELVAKIEERIK